MLLEQKVSEYDQEIPQLHTADVRKSHITDTRKTIKAKQPGISSSLR